MMKSFPLEFHEMDQVPTKKGAYLVAIAGPQNDASFALIFFTTLPEWEDDTACCLEDGERIVGWCKLPDEWPPQYLPAHKGPPLECFSLDGAVHDVYEPGLPLEAKKGGRVMECYNCKVRHQCFAAVQPGSVMCRINLLQSGATHADERPSYPQAAYCAYCGQPLRIIGQERFCNNVRCQRRYVSV